MDEDNRSALEQEECGGAEGLLGGKTPERDGQRPTTANTSAYFTR